MLPLKAVINEYKYSNDYTAEIKIWFMAVHVDV